MHRAYSVLEVKNLDAEKRVITGIATTPSTDRMDDIVEPLGVEFKNPMPLLWQHRHDSPVGEVKFEKPTKNGIRFTAKIAKIDEPGKLKDRLDEAWQSVKSGLVKAVSIGFRNIEHSVMENGGWRFLKTEVYELSLVTIPANADATIQTIKSIDQELRAASGRSDDDTRSGVSDTPTKTKARRDGAPIPKMEKTMHDIGTQVAELEERRTEIVEAMKGFGDVTDLDDEQKDEFKAVRKSLEEVDEKLDNAKAMQRAIDGAKPVEQKAYGALKPRRETTPAQPKKELPKGMGFARYAMAMAAGRGSVSDALEYTKRWGDEGKQIARHIKAVSGSTVDGSGEWGSQLVYADNLASEFVEYLRPMTVLGRLDGLRRVPFNVRIPIQTDGSTVGWVGERAEKQVSELGFGEINLGFTKLAGIVVLSEELIRLSSPSAEETVRRDLAEQISQFVDESFLDITQAGTPNVQPPSVTNGVTPVPASGTDAEALYTDLNAALATFDDANMDLGSLHFVMPMSVARGISTLRNALGQADFPNITPSGGSLLGYPVVVSNNANGGTITLVVASEIFLADDGAARIDASNQATLDMANPSTGSPTFNLWQRNCVGIRAERWINWTKRRPEAVAIITGAAYAPGAASA